MPEKDQSVQTEEKVDAAEGDMCSGVKVGTVGALKSSENT